MTNRIAVSLAPPDTATCLSMLHTLAPQIGMAEVRLDRMGSFDLPYLIGAAPCPLIVTCRPSREGGAFAGGEEERLAVLTQAMELGCAYVDVEWDSVATLAQRRRSPTQIIVSRHWADRMPTTMMAAYAELRRHADVVKLVGMAQQPTEILPIIELLRDASGPVIAIAMGASGQLTRLLAPCFATCLLTYGAATPADTTAPGQISVSELANVYHLQDVGPHTHIHLHLCESTIAAEAVIARNTSAAAGTSLWVPLRIDLDQARTLAPALRLALPHLTLTADPALAAALQLPGPGPARGAATAPSARQEVKPYSEVQKE